MDVQEEFDVIVLGGGAAGAVCAASLAIRGAKTLLVAETKTLGRNVRSVEIEGHRAPIQQPMWFFGPGGGNWMRVIREQNLPTRIHLPPPIAVKLRHQSEQLVLPVLVSAKATCDAIFRMLPLPVTDGDRRSLERVLYAGLSIPIEELGSFHDVSVQQWLDEQQADDLARFVIESLAGLASGLPVESVRNNFSVFGLFVHIRSLFSGGDGVSAIIEPDIAGGFIEPLATRVEEYGGVVWRGTRVSRVSVDGGRVTGIEMADGRKARASRVAIGLGNSRLTALFDSLPAELGPALTKEAALATADFMLVTLFNQPVSDLRTFLAIADPSTESNMWIAPLHELAPWCCSEGEQLYVMTWCGKGGGDVDGEQLTKHLNEVADEEFPGWTKSIVAQQEIRHAHHWLNPCFTGPKVPRRSSTTEGLFYVGESTEPVVAIGIEQAAYAGYQGALEIAAELGFTQIRTTFFDAEEVSA